MWNPLSWVIEAAAIMAIALAHGGVSPYDFNFFLCLPIIYNKVNYMILTTDPVTQKIEKNVTLFKLFYIFMGTNGELCSP